MGNGLLEHLKHENWSRARRALKRVNNKTDITQTLTNALAIVGKKPSVPSSLIQGISAKLKNASSSVDRGSSLKGAKKILDASKIGHYFYPLFREAPIATLRVLLRELVGMYSISRGANSDWYLSFRRGLGQIIVRMWVDYLKEGASIAGSSEEVTITPSVDSLWSVSSITDLDDKPDLCSLWQRTELLLRAAMKRMNPPSDRREWLVVHAIAKLNCPTIVLWFALKLHPDQIRKRDSTGSLPLHYAAKSSHQNVCNFEMDNCFNRPEIPKDLRESNMSLVLFLVSRFPQGARYADCHGRLPLGIMVMTRSLLPECDFQIEALVALVAAAPEALVTRDTTTRLYPYQAAAAQGAGLGVIYNLLIENPASLKYQAPLSSSNEMKYNGEAVKETTDL